MREQLSFLCEGATCAATLDRAERETGLLIVSGGNEIRSGAHRGMAWLASETAAAGYPVLRFDRRGIGDSEGPNGGFESSAADIAAALALFRAQCPAMTRVVGFGNCDAATALLLHQQQGGPDALLLANPWTIDPAPDGDGDGPAMPPPAAIRARYLAKLKNPREWLRLLRGGVNLGKLARGLRSARQSQPASQLAERMNLAMGLIESEVQEPIVILLAKHDATAMAFAAHWTTTFDSNRNNIWLQQFDSGSHSFADDVSRAWLRDRVLEALGAG